jgi:Fur family ferric uptake transcriptional regulator
MKSGPKTSKQHYRTRQREAIQRVLSETKRPLTAQDICEFSAEFATGLGIATVYRNLKKLGEEGLVRLVEVPGSPPHYELASEKHHHHFVCEKCGRLTDFEGCSADLASLVPAGHKLLRHEIVLYGECPGCQKKGSAPPRPTP